MPNSIATESRSHLDNTYPISHERSIDRQLRLLLIVYLVALVFLAPFGVSYGPVNMYLSDVLSLAMFVLCFGYLAVGVRMTLTLTFPIACLIFFVFLEVVLPILGVGLHGGLSYVSSTIRALLVWGPALLFFALYRGRLETLLSGVEKTLKIGLVLSAIVVVSQAMIFYGFLPELFNIKRYLVDFAVNPSRFEWSSSRFTALFSNPTSLAAFAVISLSYFLARYIVTRNKSYLRYLAVAIFILVLAVSRAALASGVLIVLAALPLLGAKWFLLKLPVLFGSVAALVASLRLFGFDATRTFNRLSRLQAGVTEDYSFAQRLFVIWPTRLEEAQAYPLGTLTNPTTIIGTIDSGYLTYYIKSPLILVAVVALLASLFFFGIRAYTGRYSFYSLLGFFVGIYLFLTMVISNPVNSPLPAFFLTLALFGASRYRRGF